jgi:hypothetical protein
VPTIAERLLALLAPQLLLCDMLTHQTISPSDPYYPIGIDSRQQGEPSGLDQYGEGGPASDRA